MGTGRAGRAGVTVELHPSGGGAMAIAVLFEFPNDSVDKYDEVLQMAPELKTQPARSYHVCYKLGGGFGVVDVWDSEEAFSKFGELLGPVLEKLGIQGQPTIRPVHNTIT